MADESRARPWIDENPAWMEDREADPAGTQLHRVYNTGKYCDLTVTCNGRTFKTHKLMLSAQSKVFAAMIDAGFKEGKTSHINLPDDNPKTVEFLLQYLYLGQYQECIDLIFGADTSSSTKDTGTLDDGTNTEPPTSESKGRCMIHAQVYRIADKYDIPGLVNDAADSYYTRARQMKVLQGSLLTERCIEFLESIPTVYTTPALADGNDLRTMAASYMAAYAANIELCAQRSPTLKDLREQTLRETPDFAVDVALRLMKKPTPVCLVCAGEGLEAHGYKLGSMNCTACGENGSLVCRMNGEDKG